MAFQEEPAVLYIRMKEVFEAFDSDQDEFLDIKQLRAAITAIMGHKPSKDEINSITASESGYSFEAFVHYIRSHMINKDHDYDILVAFTCFDKKREGYITVAELKVILGTVFRQIPEATVEQIFSEVDLNGSGKIDLEAFTKLMKCVDKLH